MDNKKISVINSREDLSLRDEVRVECARCASQCVDGMKGPLKVFGERILDAFIERGSEWLKDQIHQWLAA